MKSLGFELNDVELNHIFKEFKQLADVKRQVFDEDIESLITNNVRKQNNRFELQHLTVTSGTTSVPTATITMITKTAPPTAVAIFLRHHITRP